MNFELELDFVIWDVSLSRDLTFDHVMANCLFISLVNPLLVRR